MNGIAGRLIKGTAWIGGARLLINVLAVLSTFVLARMLTPADFGLVATAMAILVILTGFTEISLSEAIIRLEDPTDAHLDTAWTLNGLRGAVLCAVTAALAFPIADWFDDPRLVWIMYALGLSLLISGLVNPRIVLARRNLIFWQEFMISVGQKLAGFVVAVTIAIIYQSYWALVIGALATQLGNVVLSYVFMPYLPKPSFRHTGELFAFSGWLSAGTIVNTLNWRFDHVLVAKLLGGGALGLYSMGGNLAQMATREITAPLNQTIYPGFANVRDDSARLASAYQRSQSILSAVSLPAGVGVAIIAEPLVRLAMGEKWLPVVIIIQLLAPVFAFQTFGSLARPLGMALGQTKRLFLRDLQLLIIRVPIIVFGALAGGLIGVVIARIAAGLLSACINMMLVGGFIGLGVVEQLKANFRTVLAIAAMAAVGVGMQAAWGTRTGQLDLMLNILSTAGLCAGTYVATMALAWKAAGMPNGPEAELLGIMRKYGKRLNLPNWLIRGKP